MSRFSFTESFKQTIAEFENLPEGSKADYFRSQGKDRTMTDTPPPDLTAPDRADLFVANAIRDVVNEALARYDVPSDIYDRDVLIDAACVCAADKIVAALAIKLEAAEAERDAALEALEPFSIMAGVLFAMNYELSDDVFSIKAKHGEVAMTFEAFLNARAAARQKGGE